MFRVKYGCFLFIIIIIIIIIIVVVVVVSNGWEKIATLFFWAYRRVKKQTQFGRSKMYKSKFVYMNTDLNRDVAVENAVSC